MAFEIIEVEEGSSSSKHTGVSVGLSKMRGGKALLKINVRPHVMAEMGFTDQDHFVPMLGSGEDFGMIRLQKNKTGKLRATHRTAAHNASYYCISLRHRPEFVDRVEKAVPCQWEKIDFTTMEIILPPWADETNPNRRKRIAGEPATIVAGRKDADRRRSEAAEADLRRSEREQQDLSREVDRVIADALKDVPEFRGDLGLSKTETSFLSVLAKKAGRIVTKEALMTLLYADKVDDAPDEKVIDVWVCKIRPKLPPGLTIDTVHGQGYRLQGDISALHSEAAAA